LQDENVVEVGLKGTAAQTRERKSELPRYYYRLSARDQRTFLRSDSIERFEIVPNAAVFSLTTTLMRALDFGAPSAVERVAQSLVDELCRLMRIRSVHLEVRGVRPHNARGELHGIFYPRGPARQAVTRVRALASAPRPGEPLIALWMRTAQRHDVVKPKTFLRTLMHELGHYLDYALLRLDDSFHTAGFFKRESFLVRTLYRSDSAGTTP
jgi:hypothetical protein